jgi:arginase
VLYQLSYLASRTESSHVPSGGSPRPEPGCRIFLRRPGASRGGRYGCGVPAEARREITVIGATVDLGQERRGVDMGPSAIRYAGLDERLTGLGYVVRDRGNVTSVVQEAVALEDPRARFLPQIMETCGRLARLVADATREGSIPLVLGGDHSVALGTLGGLASVHGAGGLIWIDAHADANTPDSSPSGNVHGMSLAASLGLAGEGFVSDAWPLPAVDPKRVALIGIRELDEREPALLRDAGVRVFTMSEVDRIGIERAVRESLDRVAGAGFVHLSLDMDALDPEVAPGVGTPVRGGLTYREAHLALELAAESGLVGSLEVVEVNPILDRQNTTALTAVELVASALGKRIL